MSEFRIDDDQVNAAIVESERRIARIRQARVQHCEFIFNKKQMVFDEYEFECQYPGELEFEEIQPYCHGKNHSFHNFAHERLRIVHLDHLIGSSLLSRKDVRLEIMNNGQYLVAFPVAANLSLYAIRDFDVLANKTGLFKDIDEFYTTTCNDTIFICFKSKQSKQENSSGGEETSLVVMNSQLEIVTLKTVSVNSKWSMITADESYVYMLAEKEIKLFDHGLNLIHHVGLQSSLSEGRPKEFKVNKNCFFIIDIHNYARKGDMHSGVIMNKFCSNALSLVSIRDKVYIIEEFSRVVYADLRLIAYDQSGKYQKTYYLEFDTRVHRVLFNRTSNRFSFYDTKNLVFYEILEPFVV